MKLKSNDYGSCPNCDSTQSPQNVDGKTDSITYVDERGGEHNYLVNSTTYVVTPPTGEFDTLALDTPSSGYYTLTFRNGVQYVFQAVSGGNLKTTPGKTAVLSGIKDPYGNQLNFGYTNGNLTSITDNLGISGRTGLVLTYFASNQLKDITDWTGRKWIYTYDSYENLQSVTNPIPKTIQYSYNPASSHNLSLVTLPESRNGKPVATSYSYYQNGKTFKDADALGNTETLDYDLYRKITRVTDPRGFIRQYEYDQNGLMTKLTEPDNGILMFSNTSDLLRYLKTDALGYKTTYSYRNDHATTGLSDTGGNVTQEQDTLSYTLQYTYGIYDQIATAKDKNGNTRTMAYYTTSNPATGAVAGKPQSVTLNILNGASNVKLRDYTYNADGTVKQMIEYIDPSNSSRQRITNYTYQPGSNGLNLVSMTVAGATQGGSYTVSYTYDSLGRKTTEMLSRRKSSTDPSMISLTTSYQYDALDRVTRVTDPTGNVTETLCDGDGKVKQVNGYYLKSDGVTYDSRMGMSVKAYDAADRLVSDTDIYGNVTQYAYDAAGNLIQSTDPNGHVINYEYDAMNRKTAVIDANGFKSQIVYDLAGRPVKAINPLGKTVKTDYDALGRPTTMTSAMGGQTKYTYDGNGNVLTMVDANANAGLQPRNSYGATVYKQYDELNRVKLEVDALNGQTKYTYDLLGNITSITDAENRTTWFDYDDLGRLVKVYDPLTETPTDKVTTFTYDEAGNVLTRTNRSGAQAVYTHDFLNRMTNAQYTSGAGSITETTTYDIYGNKKSVANADVAYTFYYDLKNRLTQKTDGRAGRSIFFAYDNAGNIKSKQNYDGSTVFYTYDSANKLIAETNQDFLQASYQYDAAGRLLNRILSNGAMTSYTWDDNNRLLTLTNTTVTNTVNSITYQRDWLGNILTQTDSSGATNYVYDADYRLTSATYPISSNSQSFTYDKVGNRLTKTKNGTMLAYVYDVDNRLKEIHRDTQTGPLQNSFTYDDDGNRTAKKNGSGTTIQSYAFDAKGRVKTITTTGVGIATSLTYDPMDYRIAKSDSKGSLTYLLEGERIDAIMTGSQFQARYMRGSVVDEVVNGFQYDTGNTWTNYTFHHDMLQSVVALSGHNGTILQLTTYGPFGEKFSDVGGNSNNCLGWTGREHDPDSGLIYFRARYEDPDVGGFISEDPEGFKAGVNFYVYASNNPINANDPFGQEAYISVTPRPNGQQGFNYMAYDNLGSTPLTGQFNANTTININQLQPGNYTVSQRPTVQVPGLFGSIHDWIFGDRNRNAGNPTISNTNDWNTIVYSDGQTIQGAQIHPGRNGTDQGNSLACLVTTQEQFNNLNTMFHNSYDNGGVYLSISEPYQYDSGTSSAAGGFLIYPNKANNNMMKSVYQK